MADGSGSRAARTAAAAGTDPFSFSGGGAMSQTAAMVAMMWTAPLRAAAIVTEQAMRETGPRRD